MEGDGGGRVAKDVGEVDAAVIGVVAATAAKGDAGSD
jgi:hypothetical protein